MSRLSRVNGLTQDFQLMGTDSLVVTLASLTRHIIGSLRTNPALAPLPQSLRLSVASRDCFLDFVHAEVHSKDRYRPELDDRDVSARVGALTSIGQDWSVASWLVE